ncbi:hypothetical protein [Streptomyces malaysiensis]|uniref:hypothetical protein n=1 Tax=Streptomyces malaysiensis TaxID=92644 RepID=UPI00369AD845
METTVARVASVFVVMSGDGGSPPAGQRRGRRTADLSWRGSQWSSYTAADGPHLETVLVDLLSALLARQVDAVESLPPESRRRTLVLRIRAFIGHHLHDPDLTPGTIAAAHTWRLPPPGVRSSAVPR